MLCFGHHFKKKKKKKKKGPPVITFFVRNKAEIGGGGKSEKNVSSKFESNILTHVPTFNNTHKKHTVSGSFSNMGYKSSGGFSDSNSAIAQGQNLQFPKVFSVCTLQVYIKFTENVTLQVSRCVNYTVH